MFSRRLSRIAGTLALFPSRSSARPPHTFTCSYLPIPESRHALILEELRRNGSDRLWPRSTNDKSFFVATNRIAAQTSTKLRIHLSIVQNILNSMIPPRIESLLKAKQQNRERLLELNRTGGLVDGEDEHGCKSNAFRVGGPYQCYLEYKHGLELCGSVVANMPRCTGYEEFQKMLRDLGPEGFADGPEEMGGSTFTVVWSTDGIEWSSVGNEEEFWKFYQTSAENTEKQFTILFLKNNLVPPEEQDWSQER